MLGIDDKYFKEAIEYTQNKLGFGSGKEAVDTLGKLIKKDDPASAAVAASAPVPQFAETKYFGLTQNQALMAVGGLVVAYLLIRKLK